MACTLIATIVLLLGLQSLATSNAESPLVLSKVERRESEDKSGFTFSATFKASQKPTAQWTEGWFSHTEIQGSTISYDDLTKSGEASLTLSKNSLPEKWLNLNLGDLTSQYFQLTFNLKGEGTLEEEIDRPVMEISPGTDVPYEDGSKVQVEVSYSDTFKEQKIYYKDEYFTRLHVKSRNEVVTGPIQDSLVKVAKRRKRGKEVDVVKFKTKDPVNGIVSLLVVLRLTKSGHSAADTPLTQLHEKLVLKVHVKEYRGPFPDSLLYMKFYRGHCSSLSSLCSVICSVHGNEIETIELLEEHTNGTTTAVVPQKTVDASYDYYLFARVDLAYVIRTFICKATAGGGQITKETKIVATRAE